MCLKLLTGLLTNGLQGRIREAIHSFRQNRRIIDIQRNFLKRLLMSKAGLVLIGFKKFMALPSLRDKTISTKASRFESGLMKFVNKTLRRTIDSFKHEYESAQQVKKRAVIQMINVTMSGQKKYYLKWL